mgnify:CR=1 FL=1
MHSIFPKYPKLMHPVKYVMRESESIFMSFLHLILQLLAPFPGIISKFYSRESLKKTRKRKNLRRRSEY